MAVAGGVANVLAEQKCKNVSNKTIDEAQTVLNTDKEVTEKIAKKHGDAQQIAAALSTIN